MRTLLANALLIDLDPPNVRKGSLLVQNGTIVQILAEDATYQPVAGEETLDCTGQIIMPALVNGHTHLYSSLAPGMPPPHRKPTSFVEILDQVWWRLDSALDDESVWMSAFVGAARAALNGCGTLVDHHASPNAIPGSLDLVKDALNTVGLRGVLCYEVTDRNGMLGAEAGLKENARFGAANRSGGRFAGMAGAHASFTLGDTTLQRLAELADEYSVGVHIHCAEDEADVENSFRREGIGLMQRLSKYRIIRNGTILAHCTHLSEKAIAEASNAGCWIAHNARSNMNNSVGYARAAVTGDCRLVLGTDGMDNDLFAESRVSFLKSRDEKTAADISRWLHWISQTAACASEKLGIRLGVLEQGAAADLMLLDYAELTPITPGNLPGHWFYGMTSAHVRSLMVAGDWVVRERDFAHPEIKSKLEDARRITERLWERYETI